MKSAAAIMADLGLDYHANRNRMATRKYHCRRESSDLLYEIDGYDFAWPFSLAADGNLTLEIADSPYQLEFAPGEPGLTVFSAGAKSLFLPLDAVLAALDEHTSSRDRQGVAPGGLLTIEKSENGIKVLLLIQELAWTGSDEAPDSVRTLGGILLIAVDE